MKSKIFLMLLTVFLSLVAMSQQTTLTNPNGSALDTVTQAAAEGPTVSIKGQSNAVSFSVLLTKISGTVAGTVTLQGSNKLTNGWGNVTGSTDQVSYTLTDTATQTVVLSQSPKKFLFYRVLFTPSGTWSGSYSGTAYKP